MTRRAAGRAPLARSAPLASARADALDVVDAVHVGRARVVAVRSMLPGSAAITLGRTILVLHDRADDDELLAHELVHVEQWAALGRPRFLASYLWAYGRGLVRLRSHRAAYRAIPFEVDARQRAAAWVAAGRSRPGPEPAER